ncbi:MAG: hypothetical protein AB1331_06205 [Bacillota bacterium]
MKLSISDFLKRAMLNEQELVRDYQAYADLTDDTEVAQTFRDYAEENGRRAAELKKLLHRFEPDVQS